MTERAPRLCPKIEAALRAAGAAWRLEPCRRHAALLIDERVVLVLPYTEKRGREGRQAANALAAVRRALRTACTQPERA